MIIKNHWTTIIFFLLFACSRSGERIHPERKNITEAVYASGKIIAGNEYQVFALGNGTVKKKNAKEGDLVAKGQVIYEISNDAPSARLDAARRGYEQAITNASPQSVVLNELKLSLESAQAKLSNDSLNYFRLKKLLEENAASQINVDQARTAYTISLNQKKITEEKFRSARTDLDIALLNAKSLAASARNELDHYIIRSEAEGTVYQLMKESGETVRAGEPVALLGETNNRIIRLAVDQQDISRIRPGQEVLLKTDVSGTTVYHGVVSKVFPVMNEADQTFRVDAAFRDSTDQPFIHSSVEANIIIQRKNNALIISRKALVADDSVQVKLDGKIKTIAVKTGIRTFDDVEILSGLDENSEVIIPSQK